MSRTYIIAEAGVNHNGSEALARQMISAAKQAGADAIKFQLFQAKSLATKTAEQADYQKKASRRTQTQFEMLQELELSYDAFVTLKEVAQKEGIDFIVTPFDLESLDFLVKLQVPLLKMGSGDITNGPLLLAAARSQCNIILSTGMSTLAEIEDALKVIAYGYLTANQPTLAELDLVYSSVEARQLLKERVTLLHCVSEYPAPINEINLKAMDTMSGAFGLQVGFSDHTLGIEIALAAAARGATVLEKHFTLDKSLPGPDHRASLDVPELSSMVRSIRNIEQALGMGGKYPVACEQKNRTLVRRALVANQPIECGEVFSPQNIAIKRPSAGLSPMLYWDLMGKIAQKSFAQDEVIK